MEELTYRATVKRQPVMIVLSKPTDFRQRTNHRQQTCYAELLPLVFGKKRPPHRGEEAAVDDLAQQAQRDVRIERMCAPDHRRLRIARLTLNPQP